MGNNQAKTAIHLGSSYEVLMHSDQNPLGKPLSTWTNQEVGRYGEELAVKYLCEQGMEIIDRNWRCSFGEADIIAMDDGELVLVEVKTRKATSDDPDIEPEEAVGYRKRQRYQKLALIYLSTQVRSDAVRFDVVGVRIMTPFDYKLCHTPRAYDGEW